MDEDSGVPDFKDLESKLGRKVPESLVRSLVDGNMDKTQEKSGAHAAKGRANSADLRRLQSKMLFLKQEMAHLRAIDVQLMQQLMSINEGIESIRWVMEDKGGAASQEGSLTGSLYSLTDSQDGSSTSTSLRGSFNSLNDGGGGGGNNSDGLDGLSVGSYLDTLGEELEDRPSPSPTEQLERFGGDKGAIDGETAFGKSPLKLRVESDEYYCFG